MPSKRLGCTEKKVKYRTHKVKYHVFRYTYILKLCVCVWRLQTYVFLHHFILYLLLLKIKFTIYSAHAFPLPQILQEQLYFLRQVNTVLELIDPAILYEQRASRNLMFLLPRARMTLTGSYTQFLILGSRDPSTGSQEGTTSALTCWAISPGPWIHNLFNRL